MVTGTTNHRQEATELLLTFGQRPHIIEAETSSLGQCDVYADYPDDSYDYGKQVDIDMFLWSRQIVCCSVTGEYPYPIRGAV